MPNLEEHCVRCLKRYGAEGREIHSWLDEPSKAYAGSHRQFRHDTETVKLAGELFGKNYGKNIAENIALDHIMADHEEEIKKRNMTVLVNLQEQKDVKTIDRIDRNVELEKLKQQEKRKQLRKELKLELKYSNQTPYERLNWYWWYRYITTLSKDSVHKEDFAVLERLVSEDLKKDSSLEMKWYDSLSENQRKLLHIKKK